MGEAMPRTALYYDDDAFFHGETAASEHTQREITRAELKAELRLQKMLGMGSFGTACQCTFRGRAWVVKLPRAQTRGFIREGATLEEAMSVPVDQAERQRIVRDFAIECRNAEAVLDAPQVRALRDNGRSALFTAGMPLEGLTDEEFDDVCRWREEWQSWPGYAHLHPVVHYDPLVPLLLSLPAEGTIEDLRVGVSARTQRIPMQWLDIAWQLSEALDFILTRTALAHVDVKPSNVLYVHRDDGRVHCWLSDYGDLYPKNEPATFTHGTPAYMPEGTRWGTNAELSLFEYYSTLVDLFAVLVRSEARADYVSCYEQPVCKTVARMPDRLEPLAAFFEAQPALRAHVVDALDVSGFNDLTRQFHATREWLLSERAPARRRGSGGLPFLANLRQ